MCRMQRGATPILSLLVLLTWRDSNVRAAFWPQHRAHSDLGPANSPWRSASLHDEPLGGRGVMLTTASTEHAHLLPFVLSADVGHVHRARGPVARWLYGSMATA